MAKVLIIDDEDALRSLLRLALEAHGYEVAQAPSGEDGLRLAASENPDLILLDLALPGIDGVAVLARLREWTTAPVIILSVRDDEETVVRCLDQGADDYLRKPFGVKELLARVRSCERKRGEDRRAAILEWGNVKIDVAHHRVEVAGREIRLTSVEFSLLVTLARHGGKILTHTQLFKEVWGPDADANVASLRVHVGNLRQKVEADPKHPLLIVTEPGIGYRLA